MEDKLLKVWQVDINKSYYLDDHYNIWKSQEDFYEYHFEDYHGTKDNYEEWCSDIEEEYNLQEKAGIEITKLIYEDMQDTIKWYRENRKWKN